MCRQSTCPNCIVATDTQRVSVKPFSSILCAFVDIHGEIAESAEKPRKSSMIPAKTALSVHRAVLD